MKKIALIGCGVIGERRIQNLPPQTHVVACHDINLDRAQKLAAPFGALATDDLNVLLTTNPDAVIVATINSALRPSLQWCVDHKLPALVEKPAALSIKDLNLLMAQGQFPIKIGFNHRFHPAFTDLVQEIQSRPTDSILFIRAQYGNGSRLGFEKEWRCNVELSGGGELLDQGVHVLDLASVLLPDLEVMAGYTRTHFWKAEVDDNSWAILKSKSTGSTFSFHVSSSEWKNEFRFEVYTRERKYQWLGLGRSYGPERLVIHQMKPEMGPPETSERSYPPEDRSWLLENENFLNNLHSPNKLWGSLENAKHCLQLVEDIYLSSESIQKGKGNHPRWHR